MFRPSKEPGSSNEGAAAAGLRIWRIAWVPESLGAVLDAALAKAESPLGKIELAFLAHVAFVAANPGVPRVLFHEARAA
jgi:hypothetical protein